MKKSHHFSFNFSAYSPAHGDKLLFCRIPFGPGGIEIISSDTKIFNIAFTNLKDPYIPQESKIIEKAILQINDYLKGKRQYFSLPYVFPQKASTFQLSIWNHIKKIPFGKTITYGELAKDLCTSARATGGALRTNPIPLIIPCHRVVGKTGLGGFGGKKFLNFKKFLLDLEKDYLSIPHQIQLGSKEPSSSGIKEPLEAKYDGIPKLSES